MCPLPALSAVVPRVARQILAHKYGFMCACRRYTKLEGDSVQIKKKKIGTLHLLSHWYKEFVLKPVKKKLVASKCLKRQNKNKTKEHVVVVANDRWRAVKQRGPFNGYSKSSNLIY